MGLLIGSERLQSERKAVLVLEDGSVFYGCGFGSSEEVSGEVVFSTSMVGYPESLTDSSYQGQILALTYPLVGNYGVPDKLAEFGVPLYFESETIKAEGLVIHELCERPYHWASKRTLDDWLLDEGVPGIFGVDTRRLTKKLRTAGVMLGILKVCEGGEQPDVEELWKDAENMPDPNMRDLVGEVSIEKPVHHTVDGRGSVVLIDCGVKYGILRNLLRRGIDVTRVPYNFSADEVLEYNPNGVVISNGPGDPKRCNKTIECVRELIETNVPIMGICLGNQILALACGGDTYKLKYGHRSQNQPVLDLETGRCYITTQNHGYTVDPDSLKDGDLELWFINANDRTNEGTRHVKRAVFGAQWHPEASPGPYDTEFLFDRFIRTLEV